MCARARVDSSLGEGAVVVRPLLCVACPGSEHDSQGEKTVACATPVSGGMRVAIALQSALAASLGLGDSSQESLSLTSSNFPSLQVIAQRSTRSRRFVAAALFATSSRDALNAQTVPMDCYSAASAQYGGDEVVNRIFATALVQGFQLWADIATHLQEVRDHGLDLDMPYCMERFHRVVAASADVPGKTHT